MKMKPSVLIIHDENEMCSGLTPLFSGRYTTYQAQNGREAVEILKSTKSIDIILCDIMTPEMNGCDVIQNIRSENAEVTIIVISSYSDPQRVCEAMRQGANYFMLKPLEMSLLEMTVQNAARKKMSAHKPV